jgi:photosystem II stability/assembly factor-like uncharacterized protein
MKLSLIIICIISNFFTFAQSPIPLKGDELFGSIKARQIGPAIMSGRVSDLEGHPTNPRVIYAGTAGGGVWKTADAGITWNPITEKMTQSIGAVALDPKNPDQVIWVGTGECWTRNSVSMGDGIYKSTDGGLNFNNVGLPNSEHISSIVIDPINTNTVFVGVQGRLWGPSADRGIYKTIDSGKTWDKIFSVDENTGCSDLTIDPKNPNIMYAAFWEHRRLAYSFNSGGLNSALYKSIDAGKTWNKIHNGFPTGKLGRIGIAVAPSNPNILYSVIESEKPENKGLYRSENAGDSWKKVNGDFELTVRPFYFSRIVVDSKNSELVYKAGLNGSVSKDGGKTFKVLGSAHGDVHDFYISPTNSDVLFVATDGGIYRSYNGGSVFDHVKCLPVGQFYQVSTDNAVPYKVYGGLQDNQSWYGPSDSPGGIENRDWFSVGAGDGFRVYKHPTKDITYSEMQGADYIWRYDINAQQSKIIKPYQEAGDPKLRFNWNAALNISPNKADRIYVGSQFLHKSDDMGDTWTKISPDLTTNDPLKQQQENSGGLSVDNSGAENHCTIFTVSESPIDEKIIWVGTDDGNVQLTTDGGKNWSNVTANIPGLPKNTWVHFIEPGHFDKNTAYATFDGHNNSDFNTYVYKTIDAGKTWKSIGTGEIKSFARHIREDLVNPNLLFLGTEGGLYITVDGGQNWSQFKNNFPPVPVHYMEIQPRENDLVVATHGRGIIIIDDITPLRQVTNEILTKDVYFFDRKPTVLSDKSPFSEGSDAGEFVGNNPSKNAKIVYYLKSRHSFGKMSLEILDEKGSQIVELVPGKAKGINIVTWDGNMKPPKVAKGKTISQAGFSSVRVLPGTYNIKLTKGTQVFEKKLILQADQNSIHSPVDRNIAFETSLKLYNMTEYLAYLVDQVDMMNDSTLGYLNRAPKLKKDLEPLSKQLNTLKEKLVVTTGDNYIATPEPKLREKISNLYSEVTSYYGKPTSAQFANLAILETQFNEAKAEVEDIKNRKLLALSSKFIKNKLPIMVFRSFDEFKKAN